VNNFIHESLKRNRAVLDKADESDIKRMAFIGDRIAEAAVCLLLACMDKNRGEWDCFIGSILSNHNLSCSFIGRKPKLLGEDIEWNKATYIEASFYLDHEKYGFDFIKEGVRRIPFRKKAEYNYVKEGISIAPRHLIPKKDSYTFNPENLVKTE